MLIQPSQQTTESSLPLSKYDAECVADKPVQEKSAFSQHQSLLAADLLLCSANNSG